MKHDELRSVAHNVSASLASGVSFLIGYYDVDVFGDANRSPTGDVVVDFVRGKVEPAEGMDQLSRAAAAFPAVLPTFYEKHGIAMHEFQDLRARYWATPLGSRFTVSITDRRGRRTETDYGGYDGARIRVLDSNGRLRARPVRNL